MLEKKNEAGAKNFAHHGHVGAPLRGQPGHERVQCALVVRGAAREPVSFIEQQHIAARLFQQRANLALRFAHHGAQHVHGRARKHLALREEAALYER